MAVRFDIQAVAREGFKGVSRAQRFWSSENPVAVIVHDQDQDPEVDISSNPKETIHTENPRNIGRATFAILKDDKRLRIINSGDPMAAESEQVHKLRSSFDGRVEALKKEHAAEIADLGQRHHEERESYKTEIAALNMKIAELEAVLSPKTEEPVAETTKGGKGKKSKETAQPA